MTVVVISCYHQVAGSIPARGTFLEELYIFALKTKVKNNSNYSKNNIISC
jgi:hypothetical protein